VSITQLMQQEGLLSLTAQRIAASKTWNEHPSYQGRCFGHQNTTRDTGLPDGKNRIPRFDTIPECDGRTDGRRDGQICCSMYCTCKASFVARCKISIFVTNCLDANSKPNLTSTKLQHKNLINSYKNC